MKHEILIELIRKYPLWHALAHDWNAGARIWERGYECYDGWQGLVEKVAKVAEAGNERLGRPAMQLISAREKFGRLEFVYTLDSRSESISRLDETQHEVRILREAIGEIQEESATVCEVCGKEGGRLFLNKQELTRCRECETVNTRWYPEACAERTLSNVEVTFSRNGRVTRIGNLVPAASIAALLFNKSESERREWIMSNIDYIHFQTCSAAGNEYFEHFAVRGCPSLSARHQDLSHAPIEFYDCICTQIIDKACDGSNDDTWIPLRAHQC